MEPLRPTGILARFFTPALFFLTAAAILALINLSGGPVWARWVALHFALLGGVSQLVLGSAQFFSGAFLATDPPPRKLIRPQLLTWNAGTLMVAAGLPLGVPRLTEAGALLIVAGLGLFLAGLLTMKRRSLQQFSWAVRWYAAAAGFLAAGVAAGAAMGAGVVFDAGSLLGAHLVLNLMGWFGTAIVGTLHTYFPSLTSTRLAYPRLEAPTFAAWVTGVVLLSAGMALGAGPVAVMGWLALDAAGVLLSLNLLSSLRAAPAPLPLSARLVAIAQGFLPAGLTVGLAATMAEGYLGPFVDPARDALPTLILAGWIGMTVAGSLFHLLTVIARVRTRFAISVPPFEPVWDRVLASLAGFGLAGTTVTAMVSGPGVLSSITTLMVVCAVVLLAGRLLRLAVEVVSLPPTRPGPHGS